MSRLKLIRLTLGLKIFYYVYTKVNLFDFLSYFTENRNLSGLLLKKKSDWVPVFLNPNKFEFEKLCGKTLSSDSNLFGFVTPEEKVLQIRIN